ncbi:MAG TPA: hypothetical protein VE961_03020 [Pyrinomonadaceae bacterium]|nr:hypothetical protein [Pyrinomonadaceae bacterium]
MPPLVVKLLGYSLGLAAALAAPAQTPTGPATRRPDPIQGELQRRFEAEAMEKLLARKPQPATAHQRRELLDQIRTDFLRVQVIDDELKKEKGRAEPDLKAVSRYASEIRRRGERLKENLSLPRVESGNLATPSGDTREHLGLQLAALSQSIDTFVTNPIFESAKIVNADLSIQASHNLEQIILGSKEIRALSERLRRVRP